MAGIETTMAVVPRSTWGVIFVGVAATSTFWIVVHLLINLRLRKSLARAHMRAYFSEN
jgi:hypothetical protein